MGTDQKQIEWLLGTQQRGYLKDRASCQGEDPAEKIEPTRLATELRRCLDARLAQLAAQPAGFFSHLVTRFDGQQVTRLEMIQSVKEHELTHRSQLFLYLRLKGIVPVTTRRRQAKK